MAGYVEDLEGMCRELLERLGRQSIKPKRLKGKKK